MIRKNCLRLCIILFCFLSACSKEPERDKQSQLLNTFQTMEKAIEAKKLDDFLLHVDDNFISTDRGWSKKDAERLLRLRLMRNQSIHIHQAIKSIDWLNDTKSQVEVEIVVAVAGTAFSLTDLPSFRGDMMKFMVTLEASDNGFKVTKASWVRATPADFIL